ncbi:MAG TPA: hypothetical protein VFF37_04725 [Streptomyces sp.]|nr:hypothetical protein [Streptomyces sp.]
MADIVSAAVGEIEDYTRVVVPPMPAVGISAEAVADVVHLVAELVENAAVFSPPHTRSPCGPDMPATVSYRRSTIAGSAWTRTNWRWRTGR